MGVKTPTNLISTLIIGASLLGSSLCIVSPTRAYDIEASAVDPSLLPAGTEINGKRYWTVSEMTEASNLINAKRKEFCAGDAMCEENLSWQQPDRFGGVYRPLDHFESARFLMTSINPSTDTVKFLYHDEDEMMSQMFGGEPARYDVTSVYAVWVDEALGDPTIDVNWLAYDQRAPYHMGTVEEVEAATHLVFDETEAEFGPDWFTPNVEREYHAEGSNLSANTKSWLYFALGSTGGHMLGVLDYSSCINSPDYTAGMECKMMYSEDGPYTYLPVVPAPIMTETREESISITTSATDAEEDTTSGRGGVAISAVATDTTNPSHEDTTSQKTVSTPNTGVATREDCNEGSADEFPWWTIVLPFIFMFFIFSWWFLLPLFKHSNEKNG